MKNQSHRILKIKRAFSVLIINFYVLPIFAQWQLIDDFQQWSAGEEFVDATDIGWNAVSDTGSDEYLLLDDPDDPLNVGLYVNPGDWGVSYANTFVAKYLPDGGILPGTTGTIFFRNIWLGIDNNWCIGTSDQISPGSQWDFNVQYRLETKHHFEHRDGSSYVSTNPPLTPEVYEWYSFWIVVENSWDNSTIPPTSTGTYKIYMQGPGIGDSTHPTLIPVGTDPPKNAASLRRAPMEDDGTPRSMNRLVLHTHGQPVPTSATDFFILDDIYYSNGINLSNPLSYAGYQTDGLRDVNTGDWLGWLNVQQEPFVWSYNLDGWIYLVEPQDNVGGAWMYIFK